MQKPPWKIIRNCGVLREYVTAADYNNALMDLEAGGVDAVAMDEVVANYRIKAGAKFRILEETLQEEEYGVGFLKK